MGARQAKNAPLCTVYIVIGVGNDVGLFIDTAVHVDLDFDIVVEVDIDVNNENWANSDANQWVNIYGYYCHQKQKQSRSKNKNDMKFRVSFSLIIQKWQQDGDSNKILRWKIKIIKVR